MAFPALAAELATPTAPASTGKHPGVLAVGSALTLWTTFPPNNWGWFAWVALVPLFLLVPSVRSWKSLYLGAWLGGVAFWTLAVQWVRLTDSTAWLAWLAMALTLSLSWPLFLFLARLAYFRVKLPLMIAAPVVWVALEYVRAYLVSGFPWYYLAHSQHATLPVIQVADFAGSLGVSFLIALVNAWVVDLVTLPLSHPTATGPRLTTRQAIRLGVVSTLVVGTLAYGAFRIGTSKFRDGPRVALLQSSLIQVYKEGKTHAEILDIYRRLIEKAARSEKRPDLIVWPETSFPYSMPTIAPGVDDPKLLEQMKRIPYGSQLTVDFWRTQTADIAAMLHAWTDGIGVPMVIGTITYDHRPEGFSKYNSAALFTPEVARVQSYHKLHLVPFGEYVPLIETFPWLTVFTPYHGPNAYVPSLTFGRDATVLDLGPYRIATAICFEDTVPHVVRRFFEDSADGHPPDFLLNLSNDGWFKDSWEQQTHLAVSVFRAVENRVPLARAANTGVSAIVDGNGRVRESLGTLKEGVVTGVVPLDDRVSLYSRWGDWLGLACLAITIGLGPLALFRR